MKTKIIIFLIGCWLVIAGHYQGLIAIVFWGLGVFMSASLHKEKQKFYYVYNPEKDKPKYVHTQYNFALEQAKRLAAKDTYSSFEILEIIKTVNGENYISKNEIPF